MSYEQIAELESTDAPLRSGFLVKAPFVFRRISIAVKPLPCRCRQVERPTARHTSLAPRRRWTHTRSRRQPKCVLRQNNRNIKDLEPISQLGVPLSTSASRSHTLDERIRNKYSMPTFIFRQETRVRFKTARANHEARLTSACC